MMSEFTRVSHEVFFFFLLSYNGLLFVYKYAVLTNPKKTSAVKQEIQTKMTRSPEKSGLCDDEWQAGKIGGGQKSPTGI